AWLMISTGKRYPAKLGQADAVIPPDYPAVDRSGKLVAGQLDGALKESAVAAACDPGGFVHWLITHAETGARGVSCSRAT
ncbi:hypothetical protein, partial [Roseomonas chloroacetimidivorans]|uniref:hypothetical protein n=1 Tax=Roseomonas chloroacetimidivorans TaxID=1766656 RepID=UPI003C74D97D